MQDMQFFLFITIWTLFAIGYAGGIIYGLAFLRKNDLIDTRVPQYVFDELFGTLGYKYKLFYLTHGEKHGKRLTAVLMGLHGISAVMVFAFPIIISI